MSYTDKLRIPNLGSDLTSDLIYESYEQTVTGLTLYFTDEHSKTPWGTATHPRWWDHILHRCHSGHSFPPRQMHPAFKVKFFFGPETS